MTSVELCEAHDNLWKCIAEALCWLKKQGWIVDYEIVEHNSQLDKLGIDCIVKFKFDKGKLGVLCFQIKTRQCDVGLHRRRYPGILVVVLKPGSFLEEIKSALLSFFYSSRSFNDAKERWIKTYLQKHGCKS